ncbi:hypothetical protein K458DRAFT_465716 [Lentithecium fluviatile CBS 122367]|uniref:Uncharacterized protein n=1 Tax=Lentithecium fluviatile CBS 122367 TaxID=1168545 RepID=A0A6G1II37_9PLEO|nr:hypothetical protein K458DRAFT_465716 [Lentithecium fluviatile CBS 122367]
MTKITVEKFLCSRRARSSSGGLKSRLAGRHPAAIATVKNKPRARRLPSPTYPSPTWRARHPPTIPNRHSREFAKSVVGGETMWSTDQEFARPGRSRHPVRIRWTFVCSPLHSPTIIAWPSPPPSPGYVGVLELVHGNTVCMVPVYGPYELVNITDRVYTFRVPRGWRKGQAIGRAAQVFGTLAPSVEDHASISIRFSHSPLYHRIKGRGDVDPRMDMWASTAIAFEMPACSTVM